MLLTEVADADQSFSEQRRFLRYAMRGEHSGKFQCCHGILYQTSFQVETLPEEIFLHVHDEILADGAKRGILHNFPAEPSPGRSPRWVTWSPRRGADCLLLSTFHTFPEENTIIKSQTLIEKK